jgi:EAL domain-containing protein (putative c-di-GMP-specific phosphodiesterase class I)
MKRRDDERDILAEALAQLEEQGLSQQLPKAVVDETIRQLADARPASADSDLKNARRILFGRTAVAATLAAAALIVLGFAVGRLSGPAPLDLDELREALAPSVAASIEPALRARLIDDMRQRYQVALAAGYVKVKEELTQQYRDDLNRFAVQTLAASNAVTNRLLAELVENIDTAQTEDLTRIARALRQIELNRMQDKTQLAAGLNTLASRTESELSKTRQQFVQLLVSYQPEELGPEPRPFQNPHERNEP